MKSRPCDGRISTLRLACGRSRQGSRKMAQPMWCPWCGRFCRYSSLFPALTMTFCFRRGGGEGRAFSGFSKSKERLTSLSTVAEFTLHDLRRTVATRMASLGVAPHVVERLLNHVTGTLGGVAGVYNRFKYREEVRAALVLWTAHMRQLVGPGFCAGGTALPNSVPCLHAQMVAEASYSVGTLIARQSP